MGTVIRLGSVVAVGIMSLACSFEFRPDPPLEGTYELSSACALAVTPTSATASCPTEGTSVDVAVEQTQVTFNRVELADEHLTNTECWVERLCTRSYSGTASLKQPAEGSPYDGRFAPLSGTWEGTLTMKTTCTKEQAVSSPLPWCNKTTKDVTFDFTAIVTAHEGSVTWSGSDGTAGDFKGLETQGGVRVADRFYPRMEEQESDASTK